MKKLSAACVLLAMPLSLMWACGSSGDSEGGSSSGATGSGASAGSLVGLGGDGPVAGGEGPVGSGGTLNSGGTTVGTAGTLGAELCNGDCTCSNGIDDDDDGLIDGLDPECTGPYDDDEGSYATGIPGDNKDPNWQDCFFDGNSGAGEDGCRYHTDCLTGEKDQDDPDCTLTQECIEFCAPRTPNGCDCFGCCTVSDGKGGSVDIRTAASCSLDAIDDEKACPRCVKTDSCDNTCGRCELCPGKTVDDLPEDCAPDTGAGGAPGGPGYTCDDGEAVCGPDLPGCPLGRYCSLGCCLLSPPK